MTTKEAREREKVVKRQRYATDPAYREYKLAQTRARYARLKEAGVKRKQYKKRKLEDDVKRRQCEACGRMFVSQHERDLICCGDR